ncbi:hypothetical protein E4656_14280 [Natronospirillum operosum]|uniref:Uncharacterized protein n=1 Tax=Natronospirillum operosum TaxID=2759953 RepID=A0A4Z0W410_9GAMM|nr:hypothetical protein [Natronospirillum operosum]TGG92044.1 hypothetical protein E4656_14280 [Natronospirillum operosum]
MDFIQDSPFFFMKLIRQNQTPLVGGCSNHRFLSLFSLQQPYYTAITKLKPLIATLRNRAVPLSMARQAPERDAISPENFLMVNGFFG